MKLQTFLPNQKPNKSIYTFSSFIQIFSPIAKYQIEGNSMLPRFPSGTVVLINKLAFLFFQPKVNEVILVSHPRTKRILIKRIIMKKNDTYFVQGDNFEQSTDSRDFGFITKKDILGKVVIALR